MKGPKNRCEVCGSTELVTTFSRIDRQQVCATCDSTYSTYFRKDGTPFGHPAEWGQVMAVEVETTRLTDAYADLSRRITSLGEVCQQVLEGRFNEEEGRREIEQQYKEIVAGKAPSLLVDQAVYYIFRNEAGVVRRGRIAKGYFDKPTKVKGGGTLDAYHYWVVDILPSE